MSGKHLGLQASGSFVSIKGVVFAKIAVESRHFLQ